MNFLLEHEAFKTTKKRGSFESIQMILLFIQMKEKDSRRNLKEGLNKCHYLRDLQINVSCLEMQNT